MAQALLFHKAIGDTPVLGPGVSPDADPFRDLDIVGSDSSQYVREFARAHAEHIRAVRDRAIVVENSLGRGVNIVSPEAIQRFPKNSALLLVGASGDFSIVGYLKPDRSFFQGAWLGHLYQASDFQEASLDKFGTQLEQKLWGTIDVPKGAIVHDFGSGQDWRRLQFLNGLCQRSAAQLICHDVVPEMCRLAKQNTNLAYSLVMPGVDFQFPKTQGTQSGHVIVTAQNLISALAPDTLDNFVGSVAALGCDRLVLDQINQHPDNSLYSPYAGARMQGLFSDFYRECFQKLEQNYGAEVAFVAMRQLDRTLEIITIDLALRHLALRLEKVGFKMLKPSLIECREPMPAKPDLDPLLLSLDQLELAHAIKVGKASVFTAGWEGCRIHGTNTAEAYISLSCLRLEFCRGSETTRAVDINKLIFTPGRSLALNRPTLDLMVQRAMRMHELSCSNSDLELSNEQLEKAVKAGALLGIQLHFDPIGIKVDEHPFAELVKDPEVKRLYMKAFGC